MARIAKKIERRGGVRPGAGAKKKDGPVKKQRKVLLTDEDYKKLTGKFGTFAEAVRSLLVD